MQYDVKNEKNETQIYSVADLNRLAKMLLEKHFAYVWVEGEISNISRPASGHMYFTLKDAQAQIRCAMFRLRGAGLNFAPTNGNHVLVKAKVSLYEGRGDYQLIVESIEERGDGILRQAYELLKNKLTAEGLFDATHKKPLPTLPTQIGVITSSTGAAIRDVLTVLKRRFPKIPVIIYPTAVQGDAAPPQIVKAIETANQHNKCDVLIVCRGGGSLEDLWCFNDERVARAIFKSALPIVSGVGHEVDFTIADFVADHRAATPSAAAELVTPDSKDWLQKFQALETRINHLIKMELRHVQNQLFNLEKRLQHPGQRVQHYAQRFDHLTETLHKMIARKLHLSAENLHKAIILLNRNNPAQKIQLFSAKIHALQQRMNTSAQTQLVKSQQKLAHLARSLHAISPLSTLERGYAIVTQNSTIVRDVTTVQAGATIKAEIANGYLNCRVESTETK